MVTSVKFKKLNLELVCKTRLTIEYSSGGVCKKSSQAAFTHWDLFPTNILRKMDDANCRRLINGSKNLNLCTLKFLQCVNPALLNLAEKEVCSA